MGCYTQLSYEERVQIERLSLEGYSCRRIGRSLGRSHTTISREIKRNFPTEPFTYHYDAECAQGKDRFRRRQSRLLGWLRDRVVRRYVVKHLKLRWSPEQISGRLPLDHPGKAVSHEAIYCYIYRHARGLIECLARKHKRRQGFTYFSRIKGHQIPFRVGISERPGRIDRRVEAGHWEVDTMVSRQSSHTLSVLVERVSRLVRIQLLPENKAGIHRKSIVKRLSAYKRAVVRTITYDNGSENALHYVINKELGTKSYFCKPYHSWEKGTVENTNGLIRRYLPKKTDFSLISPQRIKQIENALNNRPRKCLGYRTPNEVFEELAGGAVSC